MPQGPQAISIMSLGEFAATTCWDKHLAALDSLVFRAFNFSESPWQPSQFGKELPGKWTLSQVAVLHGRVVGFLLASHQVINTVHVHRAAVHPSNWRGGISKKMHEALLASVNGLPDVTWITAKVYNHESNSVRFMESHGYERLRGAALVDYCHSRESGAVPGDDWLTDTEGHRLLVYRYRLRPASSQSG